MHVLRCSHTSVFCKYAVQFLMRMTKSNSRADAVADPKGARRPGRPLPLLKLVKNKMAAAPRRKFRESSPPPPSDKFLDPLL